MHEDCFICRKHRGEVAAVCEPVYEDELLYAGHAGIPDEAEEVYLGYLLLEPKRHVPGLAELTSEEAQAIGLLSVRLSRALKEVTRADHVYAFIFGHHVDHLHIHLIGRYPDAPREYWGVKVDEWPGAPRGNQAAVAALCTRLTISMEEESARE